MSLAEKSWINIATQLLKVLVFSESKRCKLFIAFIIIIINKKIEMYDMLINLKSVEWNKKSLICYQSYWC